MLHPQDVPGLSDGIYHIDSFILDAPKSAIFVGLHNDFMCDFSYSSDCQLAPNVGHDGPRAVESVGEGVGGSSHSDFDSQLDSPKLNGSMMMQACDCDFDLDLDVRDIHSMPDEDENEEEMHIAMEMELEEEQQVEEEEEPEAEEQEYDDGIGFSCDSDSPTLPAATEDDDEFVLVAGHCLPSNSSCTSSMQCSSGTMSAGTMANSSSTSMELDIILTPPPPPSLGKLKSSANPLKFLHKII